MPIIRREKVEEIITQLIERTSRPEDEIREEVESIARINGFQIEESSTVSLVEHFSKRKVA